MEEINPRGNHLCVFAAAALLSVAYQTETRSEWTVQESLEIKKNPERVISLATSNRWIARFLPLVDVIHGVGHEQISEGKFYHSETLFPIIGTVINAYRVTNYELNQEFNLESTTSWLRSKLTFVLKKRPNRRNELEVSLSFGKRSILFQVFVAPLISLPLRRSLQRNLGQFRREIHRFDRGKRDAVDNESKETQRDTMCV